MSKLRAYCWPWAHDWKGTGHYYNGLRFVWLRVARFEYKCRRCPKEIFR